MTDSLTLFVHIPKTGGTSISNMIKLSLGDAVIWTVNDMGLNVTQDTQLVMGHFAYGLHEKYTSRPYRYITILRDPVERLWSHYWSVMRHPNHYLYERAVFLGPVRYMTDRTVSYENDNTMTRMICGKGYWNCSPEPVTWADLGRAKAILHQFQIVGLYEQYEITTALIFEALNLKPRVYRHDNLGENKPARIPDEARAAMEAVTVLDRELYATAQALFEDRLMRMNDD